MAEIGFDFGDGSHSRLTGFLCDSYAVDAWSEWIYYDRRP